MKRKTDLSLNEVLEILKQDSRPYPYPPCMLINELGIILEQGEDEDSVAENYLLSLLENEDDGYRAIAFCYLASVQEVANRHSKKLSEFRANPENEDLLPFIDNSLGVEQ